MKQAQTTIIALAVLAVVTVAACYVLTCNAVNGIDREYHEMTIEQLMNVEIR